MIWIIGDEMVSKTVTEHFIHRGKDNLYTTNHYEVSVRAGNNKDSGDPTTKSVPNRIRNALIRLYNEKQKVPKWVLFILENDLIRDLKYEFAVEDAYELVLTWIFDQTQATRNNIRDNLPFKAKKYEWPYFLWIEPTQHKLYSDRALRQFFAKSLNKVNIQYPETLVLSLQGWDNNDESLFNEREKRYTNLGIKTFWTAVDQTLMYADYRTLRNHGRTLTEIFKQTPDDQKQQTNLTDQNDRRFPQRNPTYNPRNVFKGNNKPHPSTYTPSFKHVPSGYRLPAPQRY